MPPGVREFWKGRMKSLFDRLFGRRKAEAATVRMPIAIDTEADEKLLELGAAAADTEDEA